MMLRRALASFLVLTLLQLNVARAGVGCGAPERDAAHPAEIETAMPAGHHAPAPAEHHAPAPDCDAHGGTAECCAALAACAPAFDAAVEAHDNGTSRTLEDAVPAAALDAPLGTIAAPDPPPPKR